MQSQVKFNRVSEKVPEKVKALVQSQLRFNRVPKKVPVKVPGGFGAEPGQIQQGSGEGSGESLEVCGEEPGQVQQGSGEGSKEVSEKVREALLQSQVRFNRVPEKIPEKVWEAWCRFNRICGHLTHGNPAEVFPALGFAARFRKICKNKRLWLLGIPPKLIF